MRPKTAPLLPLWRAPSDHLEFAPFRIEPGIDRISLHPNPVMKTAAAAILEKEKGSNPNREIQAVRDP